LEELSTPDTPQPVAEENQSPGWGRIFLDVVETLLLSVILFLAINAVSARVRVDGFSMHPTLENGEFILVNKLAYKLGQPDHGDIVVFKFPLDPTQDLIKRVIGLPGDSISVRNGQLSINDQAVPETYIAAAPDYNGDWVVPAGDIFVLGDNRNDSSDSHSWGMLPLKNIVGKAVVIYWPPPEWAVLQHPDLSADPP
jgi:signal peptidase I